MVALGAKLPPPMEDRSIEGEFSKLGNVIRNHAQSYFSSGNADGSQKMDKAATEHLSGLLGPKPQINSHALAAMLSNPRSRVGAVRFLLGWTILENVKPISPPEKSLLPPEIAECFQTMSGLSQDREGTTYNAITVYNTR